ncbi:MAG: glycosyltransferase family 4 protein [Thermoproteota archaeon]
MQNYEPITRHDITAFCIVGNLYDTTNINLKKVFLKSLEEAVRHPFHRYWTFLLRKFGYRYHMIGLVKLLAKFEVVHTTDTWYAFSYQAALAKNRYGTRLVVTQWENIPFALEDKPLVRHVKKLVKNNADLFLAVSNSSKKALLIEGVPKEKIYVVPMGVDVKLFHPMDKDKELCSKLGLADDDTVFLFVGRLVEEKGILDLIMAYSSITHDFPSRTKLIIVGEGNLRARAKYLACRLGLERSIIFIGSQPYDVMPQFFSIADIFVLPSVPTRTWEEQFGMVLVEAMASGKPLISTLTGAIPEVVGPAGLLVPPRQPYRLYEAMRELAVSRQKREELGKIARSIVLEKYDSRHIAETLSRIYDGI